MASKARFLGVVGATAGLFIGMSAPVSAQTASTVSTDASNEGEILVTARRDTERLIDVPATVSVLTSETLARTGVVRRAG